MAIPLIERAASRDTDLAVSAADGELTYGELLDRSRRVATGLLRSQGSLDGERIAFLVPADTRFPAIQWGIWRAGAIAVPLSVTHPERELDYVVGDCQAQALVTTTEWMDRLAGVARNRRVDLLDASALLSSGAGELPRVASQRDALIVYTSGTTGGPKGVVTTHRNIAAQIRSLIEAWAWSPADRVLLTLPLHHVHGLINVLGCALWAGAVCEMLPRFDAEAVWRRFGARGLTLYMAVPTIYARLVEAWSSASPSEQKTWSAGCHGLRLMVSGSAALPQRLFERWREISGHELLERYGMTEIGMALSNPLAGERRPGFVGQPLPGVEIRRVDESGESIDDERAGELEVRGEGVFREYWQRPEATASAFREGWFRTGDMASFEAGSYRILGRQSIDIIKTGGFKVSALEIEEVLREHPAIAECAVVGLPDEEWGERVAVAVQPAGPGDLTLAELRAWAKERLAPYKVPSRLSIVRELPRNAMGKVTKPAVRSFFVADDRGA